MLPDKAKGPSPWWVMALDLASRADSSSALPTSTIGPGGSARREPDHRKSEAKEPGGRAHPRRKHRPERKRATSHGIHMWQVPERHGVDNRTTAVVKPCRRRARHCPCAAVLH